eukprot:UN25081
MGDEVNCLILGQCSHNCCIPNPYNLKNSKDKIKATYLNGNTTILNDDEKMAQYNCIVFGCHRMKNIGNSLAKAVDNGIPVIICNHASASNWQTTPDGRFQTENYRVVQPQSNTGGSVSGLKVEETEFAHYFQDMLKNQSSMNVFCNQSLGKPGEGVVYAVTGNGSGGWGGTSKCPVIAIRYDKSALVVNFNAYANDSNSQNYGLLARTILLCVQHSGHSAEYVNEQIKAFEIAKEKKKFGDCVDVVKKLQRVVQTNSRQIGFLDRTVKEAEETIKKATEKQDNIKKRLVADSDTLKKLTGQLEKLRKESEKILPSGTQKRFATG